MSALNYSEPTKKYYTEEEYFAILEDSLLRVEYLNGEVRMMAGGTPNHSRLINRVQNQLTNALSKKGSGCEVFNSDLQVRIDKKNSYVLPDVTVICGEIEISEKDKNSVSNPKLVVEVTSATSKDYDYGTKFNLYRSIKSLQEYVIINQDELRVDVLVKREGVDIWQFKAYESMEDVIYLESLDVTISMKKLYENFTFETKEETEE